MGEKKLVPKKRFSEYKHDGAWSHLNWKDTVDISINMVDPRNDEFSDLPHIGPGNIKSFTGLLLNNINTVKEDNLISGKFHFNVGDIIYGKINPQLGKYTYALYEGLASADTYILNAKNELEQGYLFVLLQTKHFFNYSVSVSKRSGMPKINRDELNEYTFCAPNKQEQQKIGEFFKVLDDRIANQERKIAKVKALKTAYLTEMFPQEGETVPKRRFKGFKEEWEKKVFNTLLDESDSIRRGPFGSALKKDLFVKNSDYVIYEQQNAIHDHYKYRYYISKEKYEELIRFSLNEDDFIMSGAGTIGAISKVPKGIQPGVINQALIRIKINSKVTDPDYFLQWIRSESMQKRLKEANPASAMENLIPMSELKEWDIKVPSLKEQQKIGAFFKNLDNQIEMEEKKLDKLQKMKEAYLEEMFV